MNLSICIAIRFKGCIVVGVKRAKGKTLERGKRMMSEKQNAMYDALCEMSGEQVLSVLLDWHGTQLLSNGLYGEMVNDGILEGEQ